MRATGQNTLYSPNTVLNMLWCPLIFYSIQVNKTASGKRAKLVYPGSGRVSSD